MLNIQNLTVKNSLENINFSVKNGMIVHLVGHNGAGKTSLLSTIGGMLGYLNRKKDLDCASIIKLGDDDLLKLTLAKQALVRSYLTAYTKPRFNMQVMQYLILSVNKCIDFNAEIIKQALLILYEYLELEPLLACSIDTLSTGQWQRVRLAGIFLQAWRMINPLSNLLLLDEPIASLDVRYAKQFLKLARLVANQGIIIILSSHDLNLSLQCADQVLLLKNGAQLAFGSAKDVLTADHIMQVFSLEMQKIYVQNIPYLICL